MRIDKSLNLTIWMRPQASVPHQWMSTRPLSTGKPNRGKCLHASATGVQRPRPSHMVGTIPARVPTLDPDDQKVPDCVYRLYIS